MFREGEGTCWGGFLLGEMVYFATRVFEYAVLGIRDSVERVGDEGCLIIQWK